MNSEQLKRVLEDLDAHVQRFHEAFLKPPGLSSSEYESRIIPVLWRFFNDRFQKVSYEMDTPDWGYVLSFHWEDTDGAISVDVGWSLLLPVSQSLSLGARNSNTQVARTTIGGTVIENEWVVLSGVGGPNAMLFKFPR